MNFLKALLASIFVSAAVAAPFYSPMDGIKLKAQSVAIPTPASGSGNLAFKNDSVLYLKHPSGGESVVAMKGQIDVNYLTGAAGITNANLAYMANATIKCRNTSGTGAPEDCTAAEINTILSAAPGGGTANVLFSRHTSGTESWAPSGTGSVVVIAAGGGGGGGGGGNGSNGSEAGEGGGGSACMAILPYSTQTYTVGVGTGGTGGAAGGSATGTNGLGGGSTYILEQSGNVLFVCPGGMAGGHGTSANTKFWKNPGGGYGGSPGCNVNTGAAGADGEDGGYSSIYQFFAGGLKGAGTGDSGGTCGGGGGGSGAFGAGGAAGGGYSCSAATAGSAGGGGGGGGSSGHPSVCNGTAGGAGGVGGIKIYGF